MTIPLPNKLEIKEAKNNKAEVVIEPCYPGYGVTLGNALRRTLLSSIEGAAVTSFKLKGVMHEFSTLPNVKEDAVEIILNLKRIRLKVHSDGPVKLNLKVKGEKTVTAGDIEKNSDVEVINKNQVIATLTDKSAELDMELFAQKGMGYVTVEDRAKEKAELGVIVIDTLYSPVANVGFEVDNVRVGDRTDYDKITLKIETDGSLTPQEALEKAASILVEHYNMICGQVKDSAAVHVKSARGHDAKKQDHAAEDAAADKITAEKEKTHAEEKPKKKRGRPKKSE